MPANGQEKTPSPYAGRWVARLHGQIVAQGGTPEQARRAAQSSRFKESPEILFMPPSTPLTFPPLLDSVRAALPDDKVVYLVGGAVRDLLLGRAIHRVGAAHDLDFALRGDAIKTARRVANSLKADFYPLDPERDTGRVIVTAEDGTRTVMDFAAFRGPDLEADLRGRDFTLNAMAVDVRTLALYDPLGGALDLREKRLRVCSPSAFSDDPLRILRAIRLAAAFGFSILPENRQFMKQAVKLLPNVSPERLRDELFRILEGPQPATSLRALDLLGALAPVLPELPALKGVAQPSPHVSDVWAHSLSVLTRLETILAALAPNYNPDTASDLFNGLLVLRIGRYRQLIAEHFAAPLNINRSLRSLLFFAALYHDVAKPLKQSADEEHRLRFWGHDEEGAEMAAARGRALQLSSDEVARIRTIVRHHMRVLNLLNRLVEEGKNPSRRAIYRFFRDNGEAGVDVCLLALADLRATYEQTLPQETWAAGLDVVRTLLDNWYEKPAESVTPPQLLDGNDLMRELSLQPGKKIGELLEAIREAQAMGEVSTREEALELARRKLDA
ncbi:MAG: HD domain-containing protein [Anaerolineales bacterium]|nr:HD domain-containing protein [Anaerolineales bacterium]